MRFHCYFIVNRYAIQLSGCYVSFLINHFQSINSVLSRVEFGKSFGYLPCSNCCSNVSQTSCLNPQTFKIYFFVSSSSWICMFSESLDFQWTHFSKDESDSPVYAIGVVEGSHFVIAALDAQSGDLINQVCSFLVMIWLKRSCDKYESDESSVVVAMLYIEHDIIAACKCRLAWWCRYTVGLRVHHVWERERVEESWKGLWLSNLSHPLQAL